MDAIANMNEMPEEPEISSAGAISRRWVTNEELGPFVEKEDYDALRSRAEALAVQLSVEQQAVRGAVALLEQANAERDAARERYQWLADKVIAPDYGDNPWRSVGKGKGYWIAHCKGPGWIEGETLDAAIDRALKSSGEGKI